MPTGLTLFIPRDSEKLPDNAQWTNRFEIRSSSSNRVYIVAQHKTNRYWGCSCPGWKAHKTCKHLNTLSLPCGMRPHEPKITWQSDASSAWQKTSY
jgi:hypothetical protein